MGLVGQGGPGKQIGENYEGISTRFEHFDRVEWNHKLLVNVNEKNGMWAEYFGQTEVNREWENGQKYFG